MKASLKKLIKLQSLPPLYEYGAFTRFRKASWDMKYKLYRTAYCGKGKLIEK